jgi:nucleoside-diphosphate-sugar epimerase
MNKNIVVTGGNGYIGSQLVVKLESLGWNVILVLRNSISSNPQIKKTSRRCIIYNEEIGSFDVLNDLNKATTVFLHLASHCEKEGEIWHSHKMFTANCKLGFDLSTFLARNGFRKMISIESYWQFDEKGVLGGNSIYAVTKSQLSLYLKYLSSRYINLHCLVLYDVYGPNDPRQKILNKIATTSGKGNEIFMSNGSVKLDYIHVDDVVNAICLATQRMFAEGDNAAFKRSTIRSMSVRELRDFVHDLTIQMFDPPTIVWNRWTDPIKNGTKPWYPGIEWQLSEWKPQIEFKSGIKNIILDGSR